MNSILFLGVLMNAMLTATPSHADPSVTLLNLTDRHLETVDQIYYGDEIHIHMTGLQPLRSYRIELWENSQNKITRAWATFTASQRGEIRTEQARPTVGTYDVVHADGLFWSQEPTAHADPISSGQLCLKAFDEKDLKVSRCFARNLLRPGIVTKSFNKKDDGFVGRLFTPQARTSKNLVVTISGSEGGMFSSAFTAAALANQGIPSLAVAYFGLPELPPELERIPLEYFEAVFNYLKQHKELDIEKVIFMGPSRGSELSLLLGSHFADIGGVIAMVPSAITWGANSDSENASAWTLKGQDIPFLNVVGGLVETRDYHGIPAVSNRQAFEKGHRAVQEKDRPYIRIENIRGPVLLIGSEDDQVWPSCDFGQEALSRLQALKHPYRDQFFCIAGGGHDVFVPGVSTYARSFHHSHMNVNLNMGGTPKAMGIGNRAAWNKILKFVR